MNPRHDPQGAPERQASEEPGPAARRPYQRPRILWRQPLEAMATECTSVPGGKGDVTCTIAFS